MLSTGRRPQKVGQEIGASNNHHPSPLHLRLCLKALMTTLNDFSANTLSGQSRALKAYQGQVVLVVNTASACGFTPQFKGLQQLHDAYFAQGFSVLGFPCNQFGAQDKGSNAEIGQFCEINYGVSFPMFAKIEVNGSNAHPLFAWLKDQARGIFWTRSIKWNFTKFLINRQGHVVARFGSTVKPKDIENAIQKLL